MNAGWSSDFSYDYYKKLILAVKTSFNPCLFHEIPQLLESFVGKPKLLIRHDVDLDVDKALAMAEIESEMEISSCYMIMTNSPFYSLQSDSTASALLRIQQMGHEIGLHFDFENHDDRSSETELNSIVNAIGHSAKLLEDLISSKVNSISFHRPLQQFLRGPLTVEGRVNAYASELMNWYLSDSKGNWREGEPLPMLTTPQKSILQFLVHPIWWGEKHVPSLDRLQLFFESRIQGMSECQVKKLDEDLSAHLTITRSGKVL
jgi:hypothetical protein